MSMQDEERNRALGKARDVPELSDKQLRERAESQVQGLVKSMGGDRYVRWAGDDPADYEYLYRPGYILVRDEDVEAVRGVLRDAVPVEPDPDDESVPSRAVAGVTVLKVPDTIEALETVDRRLGEGVATPEHVLHLSAIIGGCCPQSEPEWVPPGTTPVPPPSLDETLGEGVLVAVVDTGFHEPSVAAAPWLAGVTGDPDPVDTSDIQKYAGHGTFIAGIIRCVAPRAEVNVEAFPLIGGGDAVPTSGNGAVYETDIVAQLVEALHRGPDIISLSAGASTRKNRPLLSFERFYEDHLSKVKGTVLVAAAGNDGDRLPFWPAAFPWSVSVGALRADNVRAKFSNHGSWVDVSARGVDLVNAFPHGTYVAKEPPNQGEVRKLEGLARWSGTSFSTPLVAAMIAARMSITGESARLAADALLAYARSQSRPGVGAWL